MRTHALPLLLFATATVAAPNDTAQTMRGRPVPCELDVPASWKIVSDEGYRVLAIGDGAGLMLGLNQQNLGDPSAAVKVGRDIATKQDPNAKVTEPTPITIDGHKWLQFTTTSTGEGGAMTFLVYSYSGPEGTFVVIGYTAADQFESKRALLTHYMNTFRFPKPASTSPNGSNQSMKPTQPLALDLRPIPHFCFKWLGSRRSH